MFAKLAARLAVKILKKSDLALEERNLLTACLLDRLVARPLRDIITYNEEGKLLVSGRMVDMETARALRESARAALDNIALRVVREQVERVAITTALHKAHSDLDNYFGRAAIWFGQQEVEHLKALAGPADLE